MCSPEIQPRMERGGIFHNLAEERHGSRVVWKVNPTGTSDNGVAGGTRMLHHRAAGMTTMTTVMKIGNTEGIAGEKEGALFMLTGPAVADSVSLPCIGRFCTYFELYHLEIHYPGRIEPIFRELSFSGMCLQEF
jgi:hypothetical protein